ncbi:hypothetical protein ABK040_004949 [Willaertia magna]
MAYVSVDALVLPKWGTSTHPATTNTNTSTTNNNILSSSYLTTTTTTTNNNNNTASNTLSSTSNGSSSTNNSNTNGTGIHFNANNLNNNNNGATTITADLDDDRLSTAEDISSISDFSVVDNVKLVPIQKLREKFEHWLIQTYGDFKGRSLTQKLLFLDEFYDPKSLQTRKLLNNEEIFNSLERFLNLLFKSDEEVLKRMNQNKKVNNNGNAETFPYLDSLEELLAIHQPCVLREHVALNNLLVNRSRSLKITLNQTTFSQALPKIDLDEVNGAGHNNNNFHYADVQLVVNMLSTIISYYFALFQQYNTKFISKWMNEEINNCPNYLIDNIKKRLQKCNKYQKKEKLKDEDFNYRYLIDKDFEITNFLSEYTTDWKVSKKISLDKQYSSWKSKTNIMSSTAVNGMKLSKNISVLQCALEDFVKVIGTNEFTEKADDSIESCSLHEFKPIQTSNSLQKYATVIHTCVFNFGALFRKRSIENVITLKCNFIGNELSSVSHLYKTCCHVLKVNNDQPLKVVCYGLRTYTKIDEHKIQYLDVSLTNVKGMLNKIMSFASTKIASQNYDLFNRMIEEKRKQGFPRPNDEKDCFWMILRNYYQTYCKNVDNPLFK